MNRERRRRRDRGRNSMEVECTLTFIQRERVWKLGMKKKRVER